MFWVGSFGLIFSMVMTSLCTEYWQFILAQGVLFGLAMSLLAIPSVALVSQYFRKRRAVAVGVVIAGASLGGVLWPIIVHELLLKKNIGFPWTMRISGFIMLLVMSVSCLICRPMPKPEPEGTPNDSEAETPQRKQAKRGQGHGGWDWTIIKRPAMLLTAVGYFFACFGMLTPLFFVTSYAVEKGFSQNLSFYSISIANGGSIFGRILPGFVADRYGKFNSCIIMTLFSGVIALCWTTATSVAGLVVFSAAYGFASGVSFLRSFLLSH
jgi:MFS family permease